MLHRQAAVPSKGGASAAAPSVAPASDLLTPLQARRAAFLAKKKAGKSRQASTMARLAAFQDMLYSAVAAGEPGGEASGEGEGAGPLAHARADGTGREDDSDDQEADSLSFLSTKLTLRKHVDDASRGVLGVRLGKLRGAGLTSAGVIRESFDQQRPQVSLGRICARPWLVASSGRSLCK